MSDFESLSKLTPAKGLHRTYETRICPKHGEYYGGEIFVNGNKVANAVCPKCAWEAVGVEQQKALDEEKQFRVEQKAKRIQDVLKQSRIPEEYMEKRFDNFFANTSNQQGARDLAHRFVNGWEKANEGGWGLFFYGNPGTGKSHLACAILHDLILKGVEGRYVRVADIISFVRSTWSGKGGMSTYDAERMFAEIPLLVIDEIGVQMGSVSEQQILFSVIDARISENRPTIFLSNLAPSDPKINDVLGVRIVDRIKGKCVPYGFTGGSQRKPPTAGVFG